LPFTAVAVPTTLRVARSIAETPTVKVLTRLLVSLSDAVERTAGQSVKIREELMFKTASGTGNSQWLVWRKNCIRRNFKPMKVILLPKF